jgi:TolB protein
MIREAAVLLMSLLAGTALAAGREPVLKQVDLPHSYYWRELYLPQLTTGPSAADFFPDNETLAYSMAGSLWWQRIGDDTAYEITHAPGAYDYQPDVAPDGRSIVFVRYDGKAMELWRFDAATEESSPLTKDGAVNVEPRISPDGKRLAWVSTKDTGHFNLWIADLDAGGLRNARMLLGERKSAIDRYYYSAFDHAINPAWTPDGKAIVYVANPEVAWGSGDLWRVDVSDPSKRMRLLSEETSWSARPDVAPDGKRIVFSSYHGRQTHQLWLTTVDGAAPLPLTFDDDEKRNARWSPDGRRIVYIGNDEAGNTQLRVLDAVLGGEGYMDVPARNTLAVGTRLALEIVDAKGRAVPARVSVTGSDGRAHAPADAWLHADDGFDRAHRTLEAHYFTCPGTCVLDVPQGDTEVVVQRGFAHAIHRQRIDARPSAPRLRIALRPQPLPGEFGTFRSADLHVHMNYGGHYRRDPASLVAQAAAEDLDLVENLVVNKEERIPDIALAAVALPADSRLQHAQEHHTSYWGHLGLPGLKRPILPDFSAYRHTAMASPYPHNGVIADRAHAQGALVGYVHPFDWVPNPAKETITNALPADVAHGKVDYIEVVGFSDHKATAAVWYRLLNLGFHVGAGAGTDAMTNYASLRGPIGMNRYFADTGGAGGEAAILESLAMGRGFATNGPLLGLRVDGKKPGDTTVAASSTNRFEVAMRSIVPVDHLELVVNGEVVHELELGPDRTTFDGEGTITLPPGGWVLLRAWNDGAHPDILDLYPYATTNPVWIEGEVVPDARDAEYFIAWIDDIIAAADARTDWNTAAEEAETLAYLRAARAKYAAMAGSP